MNKHFLIRAKYNYEFVLFQTPGNIQENNQLHIS